MTERQLILIRHAKTEEGPVDRDRSLTARGERDAGELGLWLARSDIRPSAVVVSPARRALQTWERIAAMLEASPEPTIDERIYDNTVDDLLEVVQDAPDDADVLVVVGHNPGLPQLAHYINDGSGDADAARALNAGYPTGTAAVFTLPEWSEIGARSARLVAFTARS
ncbi:MAG TPA: histidine phosphatase family protein [Jatrophihabitantaceae bacterium]|nr:histidine phosphatase family protein [Jatrophihabitantaceae bacterium]